jgi:hypothetical protein
LKGAGADGFSHGAISSPEELEVDSTYCRGCGARRTSDVEFSAELLTTFEVEGPASIMSESGREGMTEGWAVLGSA